MRISAALLLVAVLSISTLAAAQRVSGSGGSGRPSPDARRARSTPRGAAGVLRRRNQPRPISKSSAVPFASDFTDAFDSFDASRWYPAGHWWNEGVFNNGWVPSSPWYRVKNSRLFLKLQKKKYVDPQDASIVLPYTAGEVRTHDVAYGYGCYSACIRPSATSGLVTSFYTYSGGYYDTPFPPWPNSQLWPHREIDIEFIVVNGVVKMQSNFFNDPPNNDPNNAGNEMLHDLPREDSYKRFHAYSFKWHPGYIAWYIDGKKVREVRHSDKPIPQESASDGSSQAHRLMMNIWTVNDLATGWAGEVPSDFKRDFARFKWVNYKRGTSCAVAKKCRDHS